jgi:ribosome maturation factor RimP
MIEKEAVKHIAEGQLASSDCYLVDVTIRPGNLIVVEIDHDVAVGIDDCVALSRYIEERIDRDVEDYELEVGSSGVGSPLKIVRQYVKNIGNEVEVLLKSGVKMKGILKSADENGITLTVEEQKNKKKEKREEMKSVENNELPSNTNSYTLTLLRSYVLKYDEIKYTKNIIRFK